MKKDVLVVLYGLNPTLLLPVLIVGASSLGMPAVSALFVDSTIVIIGAFQISFMFENDEETGWMRVQGLMPVPCINIVGSRYLSGLLVLLLSLICCFIINAFYMFLGSYSAVDLLYIAGFSLLMGVTYISVNIPILLKFGVDKGKYVFISFLMALAAMPIMLGYLLGTSMNGAVEVVLGFGSNFILVCSVLLSALLLALSFLIAIAIKKDPK